MLCFYSLGMYICDVKQFLFIIITLVVFRPIVPLMNYLVDYDYIATVLCINKDKPEMQCNGKCYLMQEMAKVAEEQKEKDTKKLCSIAFSLLFFDTNETQQDSKVDFTSNCLAIDGYKNLYAGLFSNGVLRPPLYV
ncbi:hypothetical protein SAMN05421818_10261 [Myroides phaeus]|uniref:Uncharacterized protein n=2 Tax=Myroides phaeus TaxID=702745 RepID=A0A1G8BGP8_9FLAO|nr:hypothetical protein [Myroides phaeus]SDH32416.1 hypothetical protein SAMN05421818_10261 [Myroides phaeus]